METKLDASEFASLLDRMNSKWREAVEGMTFFGEPVQNMDAERMLMVVGMLACENRRLQDESQRILKMHRVSNNGVRWFPPATQPPPPAPPAPPARPQLTNVRVR